MNHAIFNIMAHRLLVNPLFWIGVAFLSMACRYFPRFWKKGASMVPRRREHNLLSFAAGVLALLCLVGVGFWQQANSSALHQVLAHKFKVWVAPDLFGRPHVYLAEIPSPVSLTVMGQSVVYAPLPVVADLSLDEANQIGTAMMAQDGAQSDARLSQMRRLVAAGKPDAEPLSIP